MDKNERAVIGGNRSPFELVEEKINDLYAEAGNWLDGDPIASQDQANEVQKLLRKIQAAAKEADAARKDEAKPHDDAKTAIQEKYNVLIGKTTKVTGKTVLAEELCKKALLPWLQKVEEENQRKAIEAKRIAEEKAREAQEAMKARNSLEDAEAAEKLAQDAKKAEQEYRKADNAKANAKGEGRAVGLRDYYEPEIISEVEFARWLWTNNREVMTDFLKMQAVKLIAGGMHHGIPGVNVKKEQRAV